MPFSSAKTNFMRRVDIQRANRTLGFGLLALDVADPTGVVTPTSGLLAMGTDASLWKANGVTWTLVSGGSGTGSYPDDVPCVFGSNAADYNNMRIELDTSTGTRTLIVTGESLFSGNGGVITTTPIVSISSPAAVVTNAAVGPTSGAVLIGSGDTTANVAGSTGGATGGVIIASGISDAAAVGATGGATGGVIVKSGNATSTAGTGAGASGSVVVSSGTSADSTTGNVLLSSGTPGPTSNSGIVAAQTGAVTVTTATTGGASGAIFLATGNTDSTNAGGTGGDTGAIQIESGAAASTAGTSGASGGVTLRSGDSADGASGSVTVRSGAGATSGDVTIQVPTGTSTTGSIDLMAGTSTVQVVDAGLLPAQYRTATTQSVGIVPQLLIFQFSVADVQAVTMAYAGLIIDAWVIKVGAAGTAGDTIDLTTTTGAVFPAAISLNGLADGDVARTAAFNTAAGNRAFTAGQTITATAVQGGTSAACTLCVLTYRTA